jgi:hypothetical protein
MSRLSRIAAGALVAPALAAGAVALLLAAPVRAEQQPASPAPPQPATPSVLTSPAGGPPTGAIIRIGGGFSPRERWLWFEDDGTARLRGMLLDGGGQFESHVTFKSVRAVLEDAHACAAVVPGNKTQVPPAIGNDMLFYRVDVRCGRRWYVLSEFVKPGPDVPDVSKIVHGLEAIAYGLTWTPSDENVALPNPVPLFRFASPSG